MALTDGQKKRYARHLVLKEIGEKGQEKLLRAKVLVIGAGGLGSPAALYLAAAGVGTIGLADTDTVDYTNLQRQLLHTNSDVGREKVQSAKEKLLARDPNITVQTHETLVSGENIADILHGYDFVLDCTDNFIAKFLINDACVLAKKPFSHAGVLGLAGQTMTYVPEKGPCYRCIFQSPPSEGAVPTCKEVGILGALCGVIGSIQATEAIKYILGEGALLTGWLLTYDALNMEFRKVKLPPRGNGCPACGESLRSRQV